MFLEHFPRLWLILLIALPALFFLGAFIFVCFFLKLEATPTLEPVGEENELYTNSQRYFQLVQSDLSDAGFSVAGTYLAPSIVSGTQTVLMLLQNPHARDLALAHAIYATAAGTTRLHACYLELQTEFEDDTSVNTFNQKEPYPFLKRANFSLAQLPSVIDPAELYRIHQFLVKEQGGARKKWKWTGDPLADLQRDMASSHARLAQAGFFRLDASGKYYRLTLPGAISVLGKVLWPFSWWERGRIRREEKRILARFEQFGPQSSF